MKTDKEIYEYCRSNYYCGYVPDDDGYNQLGEQYECWEVEAVEELIKADVNAMKSFLEDEMENSQGKCTNCGSFDLDYDCIELVDEAVYYPYTCNKCESTGKEWYNLQYTETTQDEAEEPYDGLEDAMNGRR